MKLVHAIHGIRIMIDPSDVPGAAEVAIYCEDERHQLHFVYAFQTGPFDTTSDAMRTVAVHLIRYQLAQRM